jgi:hypothetical protein
VLHTCNASTKEAEAEGFKVGSQPRLLSKTASKYKVNNKSLLLGPLQPGLEGSLCMLGAYHHSLAPLSLPLGGSCQQTENGLQPPVPQ